jgi:quercetin dioxygenase-like cupin family protein
MPSKTDIAVTMKTLIRIKLLSFINTFAIAALTLIFSGISNSAQDAQKEKQNFSPNPVVLLDKGLPDIPNKEARAFISEDPPGNTSPPHRHDTYVFVYILKGSVINQIAGYDPVTLKAGEGFYESPTDVHLRFDNASTTEPLRYLVFAITDKGVPFPSHPVKANGQ